MLKDIVINKIIPMVSISFSLVTVLIVYYVGVEQERGWQAFVLGVALWLVGLSVLSLLKINCQSTKKDLLLKNAASFFNFVSLASMIPFVIVIPFMGNFRTIGSVWLNGIWIDTWAFYSSIFAIVLAVIYIIVMLCKKRKAKK
ncbi:MAG: hypothetical protein LUH82_07520 [Clostridiales bacterium]|nr:hypothetical protein [Clostridiales bacterium]